MYEFKYKNGTCWLLNYHSIAKYKLQVKCLPLQASSLANTHTLDTKAIYFIS